MNGTVYLVGAGPGDPDLMTLRAVKLLQEADVILHDELVNPEILTRFAAPKALCINVGKKKGLDSAKQQQNIFNQLKYYVERYLTVIRLKGGDPFIFARGAEEYLFLQSENIKVEVVPV